MTEDTEDMEFSLNPRKPQKLIKEVKTVPEKPEKSLEQKTLELDMRQKSLINIYKNENKIPVRVAPSYAKYFGRVMHVSINGISVGIRCDGNTVQLPESFATEVMRRMSEMDKYELRLSRMSKVTNNFESSPGQLNFFG